VASQPIGKRRRERHHPRGRGDRELEPDRPDEPGVENKQTEDGGCEDGARAPRAAHQDADKGQGGHHAGAHHGRLGPGEHDEEQDRARAQQEPRPSRQTQCERERQHRSEHHRDVLAAHDKQVPEPRCLEVARNPRVQPRRVPEREPHEQTRLPGREEAPDRVTYERAEHLRRPDERVRGRPEPRETVRLRLDEDPFVAQRLCEPHVTGDPEHSLERDRVAPYGSRETSGAVQPDGFAHGGGASAPRDARDVDNAVPPERAERGIFAERPGRLDAPWHEPAHQRRVQTCRREAAPPDAEREDPHDGERDGADAASGLDPGAGNRLCGWRLTGDQTRRHQRAGALDASRRGEDGSGESGRADRKRHPRRDPGWMRMPQEETAPEAGGSRRHAPAHTEICGRSFSSVAGPIPLTSSRSSTA
jgi:hypothetical protein